MKCSQLANLMAWLIRSAWRGLSVGNAGSILRCTTLAEPCSIFSAAVGGKAIVLAVPPWETCQLQAGCCLSWAHPLNIWGSVHATVTFLISFRRWKCGEVSVWKEKQKCRGWMAPGCWLDWMPHPNFNSLQLSKSYEKIEKALSAGDPSKGGYVSLNYLKVVLDTFVYRLPRRIFIQLMKR